jgi:fatty-acyl-CoA synthase
MRAERLRSQGIGRGSWLEIRLSNGTELVEHFLAGALIGAISVPIEPGAPASRPGAGAPPEDALVIMQTSGTTGRPKQCVLSHRAFVHNAHAIAERLGIRAGDRFWDPMPMTHLSGLMLMTAVLSAGATFITASRFDADVAFDQFEAERPTILYPVFPTVTQALLGHPRFSAAAVDGVRAICNIAPPAVQRTLQQALPRARLVNAYGCTELCGVLAYSEAGDSIEQRATTCGRPLAHFDVRILDPDTGEPLAAGVMGELIARGPSRFTGYHLEPGDTAAAIDADGFFHTGDLCSIDRSGRLSYHGRTSDVLIIGSERVAALEVESVLAMHPAVKLAYVVAVPGSGHDQVMAAFVEPVPRAALTEPTLIRHCAAHLPPFKVPSHVRFVSEWPMSATKVQKFRLREQLAAELASRPGIQTLRQ